MRLLVFPFVAAVLIGCSATEDVVLPPPPPPAPLAIANPVEASAPKLVVGIVVDQMRADYLTRYAEDYLDNGLMRFAREGFACLNHQYSYAPTYTGPGHAAVYTGTTPAVNGIISNNWWDKSSKQSIYCASDSTVQGVGTDLAAGQMSPHRLRSSTLCDQVELHTNGRGKTIGISLKDRGAILPAGGGGDAAYWMVGGNWVTSSWYMEALPNHVAQYNANGKVDAWIAGGWDLLLDPEAYDESLPDNNPFEAPFKGQARPTFPYDLAGAAAENGNRDIIKATPFGNTAVLDFAKHMIRQESLGQDEQVDVLAVSCSSTDYVGHRCGPMSREAQDTYLRLDRDIAEFLSYLDAEVGEGNYVVFITADHGAVHVPSHLESLGMPAGYWQPGNMVDSLKLALNDAFGQGDWIENYSNEQFFFNQSLIRDRGLESDEFEEFVSAFVLGFNGVLMALTGEQLRSTSYDDGIALRAQRGFHHRFSGDVAVVLEPGWLQYGRQGTSHGSPFEYDSHVPFSLYGPGIVNGRTYRETHIRDIAPTLAALLGMTAPSGTTGKVVAEALEQR